MKTKLLLFFFLPSMMAAQITQKFENVPGITFNGDVCRYFDSNMVSAHILENYNAECGIVYVTEPSTASTLGYTISLDPTTPNGPTGFSDGDKFGVATTTSFIDGIGLPPAEGAQAFYMQDVDGTVLMTFDVVDLAATTNPHFNMKYILAATGWEANDFIKITLEFTDCASSTMTLLDTTGQDIDTLGIEDSWNYLSADLTSRVGCKAQLLVAFSSNAAAEEFGLDDIFFSAGMTLSTTTFNLNESMTVYPNPSNGFITIKNSGVAIDKVVITDVNGRKMGSYDLNGMTEDKTLDLSSVLSSGLYFMTISSDKASTVKKIIIE
ncbi:MAG: T9SS type A sorting domain-containing protein [Flavobacteriaceae bacterium]